MDEFKYEEMISLAQAALHLLNHLLNEHAEVIQKRILALSGIFQLLGKSLLCAKRASFLDESASKPFKETQNCTEIFQGAFESLRGCLEKQFKRNSFFASEDLRQDEFQVQDCSYWLFNFFPLLNLLNPLILLVDLSIQF